MRCAECGADTRLVSEELAQDGLLVTRQRVCAAGHTTTTYEVTETVWSSGKLRHAAFVPAAQRRWARVARDAEIMSALSAGMRRKAAARKWGLTTEALRLIRNAQTSNL